MALINHHFYSRIRTIHITAHYGIKTHSLYESIRKVSIPDALLSDLIQFRNNSILSKENASDRWAEKDHFSVFSTWDGKPYFHTVPGTWLRRFLKRKN
jgi:integrase